jgi:hypothetical protein
MIMQIAAQTTAEGKNSLGRGKKEANKETSRYALPPRLCRLSSKGLNCVFAVIF